MRQTFQQRATGLSNGISPALLDDSSWTIEPLHVSWHQAPTLQAGWRIVACIERSGRASELSAMSLASRISPVTSQDLLNLVRRGESDQLEFKQSSAQFPRAGETLCAFMNGRGGQVLIGVRPDGSVIGQTIADKTFQELAQVLRRFDPPIPVETERIPVGADGLEVLVLKFWS